MTPEERCHENFKAWRASQPHGVIDGFFWAQLQRREKDRLWFLIPRKNFPILDKALREGNFAPGSYALHGPSAFASYREKVPFASAQLTLHHPYVACEATLGIVWNDTGDVLVEWDVDFGNPGWGDLASFGAHALEVLKNKLFRRKTNPFIIAKLFERRGIIEKEGQA